MFKKKITEEQKKEIISFVKLDAEYIKNTIEFLKSYGSYKEKQKYGISDKEYDDSIKRTFKKIYTDSIKLQIAFKLIDNNKLTEYYKEVIDELQTKAIISLVK
jgi:hypothetical protein